LLSIRHRLLAWSIAVLAAIGLPIQSFADQTPAPVSDASIVVSARRVEYYGDAGIVQARGSVRVTLPDGTGASGDAFSMDLRLHRLVVAGHVRFDTPVGSFNGAGLADFLSYRREYFLPLDPAADRWTFLNGDYAHPEKGREMPGDAFFLPDFSGQRPYVTSMAVVIDPAGFVKFKPATIALLGGPDTPPLPSYVYNFSANPNFGVNALSGAVFDAPLNFAGSAQSLETLHFRYDQSAAVHDFLSVEHHSIFRGGGYAVLSLNPATQPFKQWNLVAYQPAGQKSALSLETQLFTYQYGLVQPLSANGFADVQLLHALPQSSLRLEYTPQYGNLLAPTPLGYYGDPSHTYSPRNPATVGLSWSGLSQPLVGRDLFFRLESGIGKYHDALGVAGTRSHDAWTHYLDGLVYTSVFRGPFGTGLTAAYDVRRTWISFPNAVDVRTMTVTDSKRVSDHLFVVASLVDARASTANLNLTFASPNLSTGLSPQPQSLDGIPPIGGVGIYQNQTMAANDAYGLSASWQPTPRFQMTGGVQENIYVPGQSQSGIGPPRYVFSLDLRTRVTRTIYIDVSRSYFFNWSGRGWAPRFGLQVSPQ
jgi:hypothetical protein